MNNKLPVKVKKDSIFKRLFNYIKNSFNPKTRVEDVEKSEEIITGERKTKINELYKLENLDEVNYVVIKEARRKAKIEEIIQIIEKQPDILKKLDIPQLEVIDEYYKEKIKEYRKKLSQI